MSAPGRVRGRVAAGRERTRAAERLLAAGGISGARVSAVGHMADVAAVEAPAEELPRIAELAEDIKALGFRYVALDLGSGGSIG